MRRRTTGAAAIAAASLCFMGSQSFAATLFSTSFESGEGYTNGSQLVANSNWSGDGQDTAGWAISNTAVGGSGAKTGSQYVVASSPTANVSFRDQWTVTQVLDFSGGSVITTSAAVKLMSPTAGTVNRSSIVGLQVYDTDVNNIAELDLISDPENVVGGGAGHYYVGQFFPEDDQTTNPGWVYDLGTTSILNQYFTLSISVDFATGMVSGSVNGVALDGDGVTPGSGTGLVTSTDFHDADIIAARDSTATGGTAARGGFDDYSVVQSSTPEPASLGMLGLVGAMVGRRRR